jgi:hypothetical protein
MFADKLCCFIGCIDIDASPGIGFFNLLPPWVTTCQSQKGGYFLARRPAAAAKGATASQRVMVISMAVT